MQTALLLEPESSTLSKAASPSLDSPYVGPRPFLSTDVRNFFGRDREAIDLKHRVMAHPITLLYSMSGAGKSSLINARLVPDLEGEGCLVLPPARVKGLSWNLDPAAIPNIYVFHAVMSWQDTLEARTAKLMKGQTLKGELMPRAKLAEDDDALLIAVFDQFEELFSAYSSRWCDRRGFFEQLADALASISNLRVVIAMREDYVASLDPYSSLLPENLRTRIRLERLRRQAALEAVVNPLMGTGRRFAPGVADKLIDSLMTIHVRPPRNVARGRADNVDSDLLAGSAGPSSSLEIPVITDDSLGFIATSEYVEPVQLQVVCQNLWSNIKPDEVEITAVHLAECGDVDQALSHFYENCLKEAVELAKLREGAVRRWFGEELITPGGTRGLILRGPDRTGKLPNEVVDLLESRHLIHGEDRGGARWYELSHDRFLMPIINANLRWQRTIPTQAKYVELHDRAAAWDAAPYEKKASLLLDQVELARAKSWNDTEFKDLDVSDQVKQFVMESADAIESAEKDALLDAERRESSEKERWNRLLTRGLSVVAALLALALVGWFWAIFQTRQAWKSQQSASVAMSAMKAQTAVETQPGDALESLNQVLVEAEHLLASQLDHHTQDSIRNTLSHLRLRSKIGPYKDQVNDVMFAPKTWGRALRPGTDQNATHPILALARRSGALELWDLRNYDDPSDDVLLVPSIVPPFANNGGSMRSINRIAFDPEGKSLAFTTGDTSSVNPEDRGSAWVWVAPESAGGHGELYPLQIDSDSGPVADVAFSPDGRYLAVAAFRRIEQRIDHDNSGIWAGSFRLYDAKTFKPIDSEGIPVKGPAQSLAFDRTGRLLVVASGDRNGNKPKLPGQVVVYDLSSKKAKTMEECDHPSVCALFSPDGKVVVSGGVDGVGRVHNPQTGELIATLVGHTQSIRSLNFSHDGTRLATSSGDRTARVWIPGSWSSRRAGESPSTLSSQVTLVGHRSWLNSAEFNSDGTLLVTASYDRTARVWDAQTGECLVSHVGHEGTVNTARFSSRGFLMATAGADGTARVWSTGNVEPARLILRGHTAALRDAEFRPGKAGRYQALTVGADGVACLWDVKAWDSPVIFDRPVRRYEPKSPRAALTDGSFSPDGERLATASLDGTIRVWEVDSEKLIKVIQLSAEARGNGTGALGVTFSPKGTYLLTSWTDGQMRLFRGKGGDTTPVAVWPGSAFRLTPRFFDNDERVVVTPNAGLLRVKGKTGAVQVWDVESRESHGQKLETPEGGLGPVADLAVNRITRRLAAATMGPGGAATVWNTDPPFALAGQPLPHFSGAERLVFSPDGTKLVTEAEDGIGRIWTLPIRDDQSPSAATLPGLTGPSAVLAMSDGGYLATDFGAAIAQVWKINSGEPAAPLMGPRERLIALSFPQGCASEVVSINRENRLQNWSLAHGDPVGSCRGPAFAPTAAAVHPNGRLVVSGAADGTVMLWSTSSGAVIADLVAPDVEPKAHGAEVTSLAFSANGRRLVTSGYDGMALVWDVPELDADAPEPLRKSARVRLRPLAVLSHDDNHVSVARFLDAEGRQVVTAIGDLRRVRWQHPDVEQPGLESSSRAFDAFAGRLLLASPRPRWDKLAAVENLTRENLPAFSPIGALAAAISPVNGHVFLGCGAPDSMPNTVRSADPFTGKRDSGSYFGHAEAILDLAVSPDGTLLATASADNTARIWQVPYDKTKVVELRGHSGDVAAVAFSPNGEYVLTVSHQDGTARVWDVDGGDPIYMIGTRRAGLNSASLNDPPGPRQYTDDVVAAAFSSDGKLLITANGDGDARVYPLDLCGGFNDLKHVIKRRSAAYIDRRQRP